MKLLKLFGWLFIPYIMIFFFWKKTTTPQKVVGTVWSVLFLLVAITQGNHSSSSPVTTTAPSKPVQETKTASAPATSTDKTPTKGPSWSEVPVTQDSVTNQLKVFQKTSSLLEDSSFTSDISKIEVGENADVQGKKNVDVYYKPQSIWDEKSFVQESIGTDLDVMKLLFENKGIEKVTMHTLVDMTDQYGKSLTENGMSLTYDRKVIDKLSWKGFEDRVLVTPNDALVVSTSYTIHPGIFKNVKIDGLNSPVGGSGE